MNTDSVEETPRRCDADFYPPAPKYPFAGCVPAEPASVSSGELRIEHSRCGAWTFFRSVLYWSFFNSHWSFHVVHSTERHFDGRGRRRVDSRKM